MVLFIIWCRATGADCVIGNLLLNYIVDIFQQDSKEEIKKTCHFRKAIEFWMFSGYRFHPMFSKTKEACYDPGPCTAWDQDCRTYPLHRRPLLPYLPSLQRLLEGLWTWLLILQWKLERLSEGFQRVRRNHMKHTDPQKGCRGQAMAVKARVTPMCIESLAPWSICTSSPPAGTPLKAAYLCWIVDWFSAAFTSMTSDMLT